VAAHTGDTDAVTALVEAAVDAFGGIDVLVNNAATNPHFGPLLSAEESQWTKTFDVNVVGYWRLARACMPHLQDGGGSVVNVASVAGEQPLPGMGVYCVTKAGVLMLTKALAAEVADAGVRVNAIVPGFVKTSFSQAIWDNEALHEAVLAQTPLQRMAEPEELTGLALYLASDDAGFVTGSSFRIDGGLLVGSGSFE
jgi:NAD(P)-dependent dehydrogenase (short-subunit alcohol dehydrogenase family)